MQLNTVHATLKQYVFNNIHSAIFATQIFMMKKILFFVLFVAITFAGFSQRKPPAKPGPNSKPLVINTSAKEVQPVLKNMADSASYALGLNIAQSLNKDLGDMKTDLILQAMKNEFAGKPALFEEETIFSILNGYSAKVREEQAQKVVNEGIAFLEKNKSKAGVKTTASGLQYEVIKEGNGAKPTAQDSVTVNYIGSLIDGTEFDNSFERGEPLTLQLGGVIPGWTEGVQLMNTGSKYKFYIPYELGYGLRGAPPTIPGGSVLVFEIELLEVKAAHP